MSTVCSFHYSCLLLFLSIKILKKAGTIIHQPASPRSSLNIHSSCPELAENLPDDWIFTTSLSDKQVPLWFLSRCCWLLQKELVGNTPKTACFLLTPCFSLVPARSRQQWSSGDIETTSKLSLPCTQGLSASASNLFPRLQTLSGRGCLGNDVPTARSCEGASPMSWRSTPMSCFSSHHPVSVRGTQRLHIWLQIP